jgi:hypothetical protein
MCPYKRILEEEKSKHADLDSQTGWALDPQTGFGPEFLYQPMKLVHTRHIKGLTRVGNWLHSSIGPGGLLLP